MKPTNESGDQRGQGAEFVIFFEKNWIFWTKTMDWTEKVAENKVHIFFLAELHCFRVKWMKHNAREGTQPILLLPVQAFVEEFMFIYYSFILYVSFFGHVVHLWLRPLNEPRERMSEWTKWTNTRTTMHLRNEKVALCSRFTFRGILFVDRSVFFAAASSLDCNAISIW